MKYFVFLVFLSMQTNAHTHTHTHHHATKGSLEIPRTQPRPASGYQLIVGLSSLAVGSHVASVNQPLVCTQYTTSGH